MAIHNDGHTATINHTLPPSTPRHQTSSVLSEYHPFLHRQHWRQSSTPQRFGYTTPGRVGASALGKQNIIRPRQLVSFINYLPQH